MMFLTCDQKCPPPACILLDLSSPTKSWDMILCVNYWDSWLGINFQKGTYQKIRHCDADKAFGGYFSFVHVPSTIRIDNEVQISTQYVPEVQTDMPPLLSTQVYGTLTPTVLHHGPTLRDDIGPDGDFGIIGDGDDYSSEENEENGSLVDDSYIGFGSPDM